MPVSWFALAARNSPVGHIVTAEFALALLAFDHWMRTTGAMIKQACFTASHDPVLTSVMLADGHALDPESTLWQRPPYHQ